MSIICVLYVYKIIVIIERSMESKAEITHFREIQVYKCSICPYYPFWDESIQSEISSDFIIDSSDNSHIYGRKYNF